jgi:hypothetical protein
MSLPMEAGALYGDFTVQVNGMVAFQVKKIYKWSMYIASCLASYFSFFHVQVSQQTKQDF